MTLPGMSTPLEPGAARPIGALAMAVERFRRGASDDAARTRHDGS